MKKLGAFFLFILMGLLFLGGCRDKGKEGDLKILRTCFAKEPKSFDVAKGTDVYSEEVLNAITEGLARVKIDERGNREVLPAGAIRWQVSEDQLTWTFQLRDYKWSDGVPVRAQDFEYGIKRVLDPNSASFYAYILYPIKNAAAFNAGKAQMKDVGVRAIDEKTLEITLEAPCPYFEELTYFQAMLPQRQDLIEAMGEKYGSEAENMPSCGPFRLAEWTHDSVISLVRNETYWDKENVQIDGIDIRIMKDPDTRNSSIFNGSLDVCSIESAEWMQKLEATGKYRKIDGYEGGSHFLVFNQKDELFKNKKVRLAFSLAVAREEMAEVIFSGMREAAYGLVSPTLKCQGIEYRDEVPEPLRALKKQYPDPKKLLEEGLKELGITEKPESLRIVFLNAGTGQQQRTFTEFLQQMYKKTLGVNIEGEYVEWGVYLSRTDAGDYQISHDGWNSIYNDPMSFLEIFASQSKMYNPNWKSEKFDRIIDDCRVLVDARARMEKFKEAESILVGEDAVISPTGYRKYSVYVDKKIEGYMKIPYYTTEYKYVDIK